jgi:hypothetical protein
MENDPMITQRMRDTARTAICKEFSDEFVKCSNVAVSRFSTFLQQFFCFSASFNLKDIFSRKFPEIFIYRILSKDHELLVVLNV